MIGLGYIYANIVDCGIINPRQSVHVNYNLIKNEIRRREVNMNKNSSKAPIINRRSNNCCSSSYCRTGFLIDEHNLHLQASKRV